MSSGDPSLPRPVWFRESTWTAVAGSAFGAGRSVYSPWKLISRRTTTRALRLAAGLIGRYPPGVCGLPEPRRTGNARRSSPRAMPHRGRTRHNHALSKYRLGLRPSLKPVFRKCWAGSMPAAATSGYCAMYQSGSKIRDACSIPSPGRLKTTPRDMLSRRRRHCISVRNHNYNAGIRCGLKCIRRHVPATRHRRMSPRNSTDQESEASCSLRITGYLGMNSTGYSSVPSTGDESRSRRHGGLYTAGCQ